MWCLSTHCIHISVTAAPGVGFQVSQRVIHLEWATFVFSLCSRTSLKRYVSACYLPMSLSHKLLDLATS